MSRSGFIGVVVSIVACIGVFAISQTDGEFLGRRVRSAFSSAADVERDIDQLATQKGGETIAALQRLFPAEYATFRTELARKVKTNPTNDEIRISSFRFMRAFTLAHVDQVASAPNPELIVIANESAAFVVKLREFSVQDCADFGMTGLKEQSKLPDPLLEATNNMAVSMLEAARAGTDNPQHRQGELADADLQLLVSKMEDQGAPPTLIQAFSSLDQQTPAIQCDATVALYKAASALPVEASARVTAALIFQSKEALTPL